MDILGANKTVPLTSVRLKQVSRPLIGISDI